MRGPHLILGALVIVGLASSLAVVPRGRELALMYLKGADYESARVSLEERVAADDLSVGVVSPLTQVYLEIGDYDGAVALMERYAAANPRDPSARLELARLYKQANRIYEYIETLEAVAAERPDDEVLRELSEYYSDHGRAERQAEILRVLVQRGKPGLADWVDLAQLEASLKNYPEATSALLELERRFKVPRTQAMIELYVGVLSRTGREAEALVLARSWLDDARTPQAALAVIRHFLGAGKEVAALDLIEGLPSAIADTAVLMAERVRIEISLGRTEAAFARLSAAHEEGRLAAAFDDALIDLALERNLLPMAQAVAMRGSPARLPARQVVDLVMRVPAEMRGEVAAWALPAVESLERRPAMAAMFHRAVGDQARALAMAEMALAAAGDLEPGQMLDMVGILSEFGRREVAQRHLQAYLARYGFAEGRALDTANALIQLGMAEEGWRRIEAARAGLTHPLPGHDAAWALLSTATGRGAAVVGWLTQAPAAGLDVGILDQLSGLAETNGQPELALTAAERRIALRDDDLGRLRRATALSALGRQAEALADLRAMGIPTLESERVYIVALAAQARGGVVAAASELAEYWRLRLGQPGIAPDIVATLAYLLLEKGLGAEGLVALSWLVEREPEAWAWALVEEARKARRLSEARDLLAAQLRRGDLKPETREQLLMALGEAGGQAESMVEVARLARTDQTDKWLYAFLDAARTARRPQAARAFLTEELRRTDLSKARRDARLYALLDLAGPTESLGELQREAETYGGEWAMLYGETLGKLGRGEDEKRFLRQQAAQPGASPEALRNLAYRLIELGDRDAAISIFHALAATARPEEPVVAELLWLWREAGQMPAMVSWLAGRAAAAPPADRLAWARHLVEADAPGRALAALGPDTSDESPPSFALRLDALIALKRFDHAGRLIEARAERTTDLDGLRRLVRVALDTDRRPAIKAVYTRIARQAPGDPEAERWLGLNAVAESRTAEARRHLAAVVGTAAADYEVNAAYGELLHQANQRDSAKVYFRRALEQIAAISDPALPLRATQAALLSRLGEASQALALMADLVKERPADRNLRADYANLLMDNKRYDEAKRLLADQ
jgi:thioredoxin-like negative regulator of GroEL